MIRALDSATPPTRDQAVAAKAAGVGGWWGYLATMGGVNLLRPWTEAEFATVREVFGGQPVAFCSGWDDPARVRDQAAAWGVRPCLDVEDGIRGDGPWVPDWLKISGAGLYGTCGLHAGRQAAFHILAWYPGDVPPATWYDVACARPAGPVGWQSWGTHQEFGAPVDAGWYDDWFLRRGGDMFTFTAPDGTGYLVFGNGLMQALPGPQDGAQLKTGVPDVGPLSAALTTELQVTDANVRAAILAAQKSPSPAGTFTVTGTGKFG